MLATQKLAERLNILSSFVEKRTHGVSLFSNLDFISNFQSSSELSDFTLWILD